MTPVIIFFFLQVGFVKSGGREICVVMTLNDRYARPTVVALTSLFENKAVSTYYNVAVFIPGNFKPKNRRTINSLEEKYKDCKIAFVNMSDMYAGQNWGHWKAPAYYRLRVASRLPDKKKCIYFDADAIIRHDLSEMYDIDVDEYYVAGVPDIERIHRTECRVLGIVDFSSYICTGVMIMNLEKIRENKLEEEFSKVLEEKGTIVGRYSADQSVLNLVCYGKTLILPLEYGILINFAKYFPGKWERKDPTIVHMTGKPPWNFPTLTIFHKEWWSYANKTGLYNEEIKNLRVGINVVGSEGRIVSKEEYEEDLKLKKKD